MIVAVQSNEASEMPASIFAYEVRDEAGNALTGQMQAETKQVVAQQLHARGYTVVRITEGPLCRLGRERRPTVGRRIPLAALAQFYREFATLVGSGMSIIQSLHILEKNTSQPALRWAIRGVLPEVERGQKLSENMARVPEVFSGLAVAIVAAAEVSGRLEQMLKLLAEYTEHDLELHRMLSRETFYPKILAVAILTIVPGGMLIANSLSKGMFGFGMLVPVGIFAAMLLTVGLAHAVLRSYGQSAAGRRALDRMKLTLPVFGPLVQRIVMSRFTRALAALYSAGVLMPEAVPLAARAGGNTALAEDMRVCIPHLQQGGKLSEVLATIRHVPSTVISMLRTGEQTGNIDVVLNKVADYYDDETQTRIRQLGTTIMPICVIIAAIFVITILISFYVGYASKILSIAGSG